MLVSLSAYERENLRMPAEGIEPLESGCLVSGIMVALMVLIFFFVTTQWLPALSWFERGSADAPRMLQGEFWRTVTALTLHADIAHALSNSIAAALFLSAVYSIMGGGRWRSGLAGWGRRKSCQRFSAWLTPRFDRCWIIPRAPGLRIQWSCGTAAVGMLIYCWTLAFR